MHPKLSLTCKLYVTSTSGGINVWGLISKSGNGIEEAGSEDHRNLTPLGSLRDTPFAGSL